MMRVIPVGAARMVFRQRDLYVVFLAGHHGAHDVVGDAARAAMGAVEVEVRVVELVRYRHVRGHRIAVGRELVGQPDLQRLARFHAQRRPIRRAFVGAHVEPLATDVLVGVPAVKRRLKHAIDRAPHLGFDQGPIHGGRRWLDDRPGIETHGGVIVLRTRRGALLCLGLLRGPRSRRGSGRRMVLMLCLGCAGQQQCSAECGAAVQQMPPRHRRIRRTGILDRILLCSLLHVWSLPAFCRPPADLQVLNR